MTIQKTLAVNLAYAYHDIMTVSKTDDTFHLPAGQSATEALSIYVRLCDTMGVNMYNDGWLEYIQEKVATIDAHKRETARKLLRRKG
jgi:hypothetical protein